MGFFFNILYCNIRSVNAILDDLLLFSKNDKNNKLLDVIILIETWHDIIFCDISVRSYEIYYTKIKRNQNYRTIVLIQKS